MRTHNQSQVLTINSSILWCGIIKLLKIGLQIYILISGQVNFGGNFSFWSVGWSD